MYGSGPVDTNGTIPSSAPVCKPHLTLSPQPLCPRSLLSLTANQSTQPFCRPIKHLCRGPLLVLAVVELTWKTCRSGWGHKGHYEVDAFRGASAGRVDWILARLQWTSVEVVLGTSAQARGSSARGLGQGKAWSRHAGDAGRAAVGEEMTVSAPFIIRVAAYHRGRAVEARQIAKCLGIAASEQSWLPFGWVKICLGTVQACGYSYCR
jgi:hypothetical protein